MKKIESFFKKFKFIRSFQLRIFLIIILVGLLAGTIMHVGILNNYAERAINVKTSEVTNQMKIVANHLITYNYLQDISSEVVNAELSQLSTLYGGRVLVIDENFRVIKDTYGISVGKLMIAKEVIECFKGATVTNVDETNRYIEVAVPITELDEVTGKERVIGVILTSAALSGIDSSIEIMNRQAWILEIVMMIIIIGIALAVSVVFVRPFDRVTNGINSVISFDDENLVVSDYIETEEIVNAFNELRNRLKVLDDSRQEFVSNVSHELKTPLTSMKVLADSLNMQEDVPVEIYKEFMQDITEEIDRENKIITDLLALVKMEKGSNALNIEACDINVLLELVLKRLGPIARKNEVDLIFESHRAVTAEVDEVKLSLALTNLIENGIKYNKHPGWVKVSLDADHQSMIVEITDSGIGIPKEELDHIYERFYRVDKSHSKEIGGTGLGLSITRKTILLHRGSIRVNSIPGEGTTFVVRIPLSYIV